MTRPSVQVESGEAAPPSRMEESADPTVSTRLWRGPRTVGPSDPASGGRSGRWDRSGSPPAPRSERSAPPNRAPRALTRGGRSPRSCLRRSIRGLRPPLFFRRRRFSRGRTARSLPPKAAAGGSDRSIPASEGIPWGGGPVDPCLRGHPRGVGPPGPSLRGHPGGVGPLDQASEGTNGGSDPSIKPPTARARGSAPSTERFRRGRPRHGPPYAAFTPRGRSALYGARFPGHGERIHRVHFGRVAPGLVWERPRIWFSINRFGVLAMG
jgi:hypothetical protein